MNKEKLNWLEARQTDADLNSMLGLVDKLHHLDPELRRLLLATLHRAFLDVLYCHRKTKEYKASYKFIFSEKVQAHYFCFDNICAILGLNSEHIKDKLFDMLTVPYEERRKEKKRYRNLLG